MTQDGAAPAGDLDSEELLFLAVRAIDRDDEEGALRLLKRALALEPRNGVLHHLLGAVYAQLGMTLRAISSMTAAVECNPELIMARFQLGMLHFTDGDPDASEAAWQPLDALPEEHPLRLFRNGLLRMAVGDFAGAQTDLQTGLELNTEFTSLSGDMESMLALCAQALGEAEADGETTGAAEAPAAPTGNPADAAAQHVLLSGYRGMTETRN